VKYRNSEMKIDQLVSYLNEEKINLSPAFQRGHVWAPLARKKLVKNIVLGRPIPAVFLYKEAYGSKYTYNILDGKQRLESLILFITDSRTDVRIDKWARYFFDNAHQKAAGFSVELSNGDYSFSKLPDAEVREFREYAIPTVEITLDDESSLDEVISLFVDINQQGVAVNRFDIVKAMYKGGPLMKSVFSLLALEQKRGQDIYYRPKKNEFTNVLKRLQIVENVGAPNSKVDKMWEKLMELSLFVRTKTHRKPATILKEFIAAKKLAHPKLNGKEIAQLRRVFAFMASLRTSLGGSRIFTDQVHSYTVITSLLRTEFLDTQGDGPVRRKLKKYAALLDGNAQPQSRSIGKRMKEYREISAKQTTDISRRQLRDEIFVHLFSLL